MVFTKAELERAGLVNIRRKFEHFQKLNAQIGDCVLPAVNLLPTFNDTAAVVFSYGSHDDKAIKPTYNTLLSYSPLNNLEEYLTAVLQVLHLFWEIHKLGLLCINISADGLVVRVEHRSEYVLFGFLYVVCPINIVHFLLQSSFFIAYVLLPQRVVNNSKQYKKCPNIKNNMQEGTQGAAA